MLLVSAGLTFGVGVVPVSGSPVDRALYPVSGQVVAPGGIPVIGAVLNHSFLKSSRTSESGTVSTDATGRFRIPQLEPGAYRLTIRGPFVNGGGPALAPSWLGGAAFESEALTLTVSDGPVDVGTIRLEEGGSISGRVERVDGLDVQGPSIRVSAYLLNETTDLFEDAGGIGTSMYVGFDGRYTITGLRQGRYLVKFHGSTRADEVAPDYFPGTPFIADSALITVAEGQDVADVDSVVGPGGYVVDRLAGADRFAMAAGVSVSAFPDVDGGVDVAYVVNGLAFPDALSAGPAAAFSGGPLLLATPNALPSSTRAELERLRPESIVVVGGPSSISATVLAELDVLARGSASRIDGADRYAASRAVARATFLAPVDTAYLVTGEKFPDALSAGPEAGAQGSPIILVRPGPLDNETRRLLLDLGVRSVVIVGGTASVSQTFEEELAVMPSLRSVLRIAGADRYEVAANLPTANTVSDTIFLATGEGFADALAGSYLAALQGGSIDLVRRTCVPARIIESIDFIRPTLVVLLGGPASLAPAVEAITPC